MKRYFIRLIEFFLPILIIHLAIASDQSLLVDFLIKHTHQRYAPDKRTAVFDVSYKKTKKGIVLFGEIDSACARNSLISILNRNISRKIIDSIRMLPDTSLHNDAFGICLNDVNNIYDKPGKKRKLTTQILMGTVVTLLKQSGRFFFVRMPDMYLGWIDTASLVRVNQERLKAWDNSPKIIVTEFNSIVQSSADSSSEPVCGVIAGDIMKSNGQNNGWIAVELPNGKNGVIRDSVGQDFAGWCKSRVLNGENLEKTARMLLGIPYIWGGTSIKGMDCSGFTKMVFRMNGMELNRDADQQAEQGTSIEPGKNFENLKKGDLLFFCSKKKKKQSRLITHVGMSLGGGLFIHSSITKQVRISSLDSSSVLFEKSLLKQFMHARRIIQE